MVYNNAIPQPGDNLSASQSQILNNFAQLNTSFGIDHYPFTDNTVNLGKHNQVSQPPIDPLAHPATAAGEIKLYNMNDAAAIGSLQYSRGPSSAVPSPVTYLQSPAAALAIGGGATFNIVDLNAITDFCGGMVYVWGVSQANQALHTMGSSMFLYNSFGGGPTKTLTLSTDVTSINFTIQTSGTIIQVLNDATDRFYRWAVQFYRIQN